MLKRGSGVRHLPVVNDNNNEKPLNVFSSGNNISPNVPVTSSVTDIYDAHWSISSIYPSFRIACDSKTQRSSSNTRHKTHSQCSKYSTHVTPCSYWKTNIRAAPCDAAESPYTSHSAIVLFDMNDSYQSLFFITIVLFSVNVIRRQHESRYIAGNMY